MEKTLFTQARFIVDRNSVFSFLALKNKKKKKKKKNPECHVFKGKIIFALKQFWCS